MADTQPQIKAGGPYPAKAIEGTLTKTKDNKPQYLVKFEFSAGSENAGKRIYWYGGFSSPDARKYTGKALQTLGWDGKQHLGEFRIPSDGVAVDLQVQHREMPARQASPGSPALPARLQAQVQFINKPGERGGADLKQLDPAIARSLGDEVMAAFAADAAKNGSDASQSAGSPQQFDDGSNAGEGDGETPGIPF